MKTFFFKKSTVTYALGLLLLLLNLPGELTAQTVDISTTVVAEYVTCGNPEEFKVVIENNTTSTITSVSITVDFPTGVAYTAGSLSETTSRNVAESNITNLESVVFSADDVPAGDSIVFTLESWVTCPTVAYSQSNLLENEVTVNHGAGSASHTSNSYNINSPALSIISVSPTSHTGYVGSTFTRSITIVNGGNGYLKTFKMADTHNSDIIISSVDIGTLNATGDTITFNKADFTTIGDGDSLFETNESLVLTETVYISGCTSTNSSFDAFWGCASNGYCQSSTTSQASNSNTVIQSVDPDIRRRTTANFSGCIGQGNEAHEIRLINRGQGPAYNLLARIYEPSATSYSEIVKSSITYRVGQGGTPTVPTFTDSTANTTHACLSSNPLSSLTLDLPDMVAGDTIYIDFETYTCCITTCGSASFNGWTVNTTYDNACGNKSYSHNNTGQDAHEKLMTIFAETPAYIFDGETKEWLFIVSSATFEMPDDAGGLFELDINLPPGLIWNGGASDLEFTSGVTTWAPRNIVYDTTNHTLNAFYETPIPTNFELLRSEAKLNLELDCSKPGASGGSTTMDFQMFYQIDTTCTSACRIPMTCIESPTTYLYCPGVGPCSGISMRSFAPQRTNFGSPDNNEDGLPDASGSLDMTQVKANRLMYGDTLNTRYMGTVNRNGGDPTFSYGYIETEIPLGTNLTFIEGTLTVYDASAGTYISCTNMSSSILSTVSNTRTFKGDFSVATLTSGGACSGFSGYTFDTGDSVWVDVYYRVSGNIGEDVEQVTMTSEFYVSDIANPTDAGDKYGCFDLPENITLIGYVFRAASQNNVTVNNCTNTLSQTYYLGIGDCCTNYDGGNLFPFEYRNWAHIKEAKVFIPSGYEVLSIDFAQYRTRYTSASTLEQHTNISADNIIGDTLFFDLTQYHADQGGNLNYSDDGFRGTLSIEVAPVCTKTPNTWEDVHWYYKFNKADILDGGETDWLNIAADRVRFRPPTLDLEAANPIVDGLNENVTFEIDVRNLSTSGGAKNVWISPVSLSGELTVVDVRNASNQSITPVNDLYQLGDFGTNSSSTYYIYTTHIDCDYDSLQIYYGQECGGYPDSLAVVTCPIDSYMVYLEPKDADLQVQINQSAPQLDVCDNAPSFTFEMEVASVLFATTKDITVTITMPKDGMSIATNSTQLKYPLAGSFGSVSNPSQVDSVYKFDINALNSSINDKGLPGVVKFDSNRFALRFDVDIDVTKFDQGDRFEIDVDGFQYCGNPLTTAHLAHPRIYAESPFTSTFFRDTSEAFLSHRTESWSVSWADVDGDGDQDLLATNDDQTEGNALYINQGDGTFNRDSTNGITNDLGPSRSATFGDYDNDGDLDCYVTNNIGTVNWLYDNNGSGGFTRNNSAGDILSNNGYGFSAAWGDYDNDGYLDMFICDYMPVRYNKLYHNNGDGTFTEVAGGDISQEAFYSIGGTWADYDNDGDLDLFVPNANNDDNRLYRNEGNGTFTKTTGIESSDGGNSLGSSWGDYDNDGDLDLFVTNGAQNNFLYTNDGDGTFTKVTSGSIVNDLGNSHGSGWADYDNDGWLDLFVSNDNAQGKFLYQNNGNGTFTRLNNELTEALNNTRGMAWGDYDNDGDLDAAVATTGNEPNLLFKNSKGKCTGNACVSLTGTSSNAAAIGAKVRVKATVNGQTFWQMREISGATGGGTGGQADLRAYFGMGDATTIDSLEVLWPSGVKQYLTNQSLSSGCIAITETPSKEICGTVYVDANSNCTQDGGEAGVPGVEIIITPGPRYAYTDSSGYYSISLEPGTYTLTANPDVNWTVTCPTGGSNTHTVAVSGTGQDCNYNFGMDPACSFPDLKVSTGTTILRKGFTNTYSITYENNGGSAATDVVLTFQMDAEIVPQSSSVPWDTYNTGTNTLTWNLGTVAIGESSTIYMTDSVSVNAVIGDSLDVTASLSGNETDCSSADDSYFLREEVSGAVDPNDILVSPVGDVSEDATLTYKIRFQNVGNFPATFVIIHDTLPEGLDLATFDMLTASHNYEMKRDGQYVTWHFPNINLVDSTTDEANSHGFVQFRITLTPGLEDGFQVRNRAAIIFDYNEAIITNTVVNTVREPRKLTEAAGLRLSPNPMEGFSEISLIPSNPGDDVRLTRIMVLDIRGHILIDDQLDNTRSYYLERRYMPSGVYLIKAWDVALRRYSSKLMVR